MCWAEKNNGLVIATQPNRDEGQVAERKTSAALQSRRKGRSNPEPGGVKQRLRCRTHAGPVRAFRPGHPALCCLRTSTSQMGSADGTAQARACVLTWVQKPFAPVLRHDCTQLRLSILVCNRRSHLRGRVRSKPACSRFPVARVTLVMVPRSWKAVNCCTQISRARLGSAQRRFDGRGQGEGQDFHKYSP